MTLVEHRPEVRSYLLELVKAHDEDPEYGVEFACWFRQDHPDTVVLLEVSPNVLDPGDASFYEVNMAVPRVEAGVGHIQFVLVSPAEFHQAAADGETRGGALINRLRRTQAFDVLSGAGTPYEEALRCAAS